MLFSWPWQTLLTVHGLIVFVVTNLGSIENILESLSLMKSIEWFQRSLLDKLLVIYSQADIHIEKIWLGVQLGV